MTHKKSTANAGYTYEKWVSKHNTIHLSMVPRPSTCLINLSICLLKYSTLANVATSVVLAIRRIQRKKVRKKLVKSLVTPMLIFPGTSNSLRIEKDLVTSSYNRYIHHVLTLFTNFRKISPLISRQVLYPRIAMQFTSVKEVALRRFCVLDWGNQTPKQELARSVNIMLNLMLLINKATWD